MKLILLTSLSLIFLINMTSVIKVSLIRCPLYMVTACIGGFDDGQMINE